MTNLLFFAQDKIKNCPLDSKANDCFTVLPESPAGADQVRTGLAVVFAVLAAVAVIIIIVSAINLAASEGNPENISKAKKSIIYALVGLIIALSAEAAVLTLIGRI